MIVQHGASVFVTDGRKALLLRNEGDGEYPNFRLVVKWEHKLPPDRELKTEAPGRSFGSLGHGNRRSSYEETDFHDQAENDFAANAADFLNEQLQQNAIEEVVIIAPPRTLGVLRKHLRGDVADRIAAEIDKDLVKHPLEAIERLVAAYPEPA